MAADSLQQKESRIYLVIGGGIAGVSCAEEVNEQWYACMLR